MKFIAVTSAVILILTAAVQAVVLPKSERMSFSRKRFNIYKWKKKACLKAPYLRCYLSPIGDFKVTGTVDFRPVFVRGHCRTNVNGTIMGMPNRSGKHGWHVHEFGDISDTEAGLATGGHFNPRMVDHGIPGQASTVHEGDLGNLEVNKDGVAVINIKEAKNPVTYSVLGRGLVIHRDYDEGSQRQPTGNSGARIAQCVLGRIKH